jgi:ribosomal protein S18 acetylase RimI-like enzyme
VTTVAIDLVAGIDLAGPGDAAFLWEMLTHAASMVPPGTPTAIALAQADPYLRTYVDGWGRPDDLGVIARDAGGAAIGAAWLRAGLIVAEPRVPELATATVPAHRGHGVGTAMMNALFPHAARRFDAIILSVRATNPALRFYERLGFGRERTLTNRVGGVSFVMRRALDAVGGRGRPPASPPSEP